MRYVHYRQNYLLCVYRQILHYWIGECMHIHTYVSCSSDRESKTHVHACTVPRKGSRSTLSLRREAPNKDRQQIASSRWAIDRISATRGSVEYHTRAMSSRAFRRLHQEAEVVKIRAGLGDEGEDDGETEDRGPGVGQRRRRAENASGNLFAMVGIPPEAEKPRLWGLSDVGLEECRLTWLSHSAARWRGGEGGRRRGGGEGSRW